MAGFVPYHVNVNDIEGIGFGTFAQVGRVGKSGYVVKVPSNNAYEYFDREKMAYERLGHHPNIVRFFGEACISSGEEVLRGLILEYHQQGTLDKIISTTSTRTLRAEWARQVIEAIRHIHSCSIVHGDFGCHNILVTSDGSLALADFGGSRIDGSECLQFAPAPYAMPGRHQDQSDPTERNDLFALGTVLYEISSGHLLWRDLDDNEVRRRFAKHQYPSLEGVPGPLAYIIMRCWRGQYATIDEVANDLEKSRASPIALFRTRLVGLGLLVSLMAVGVQIRRGGFHRPSGLISTPLLRSKDWLSSLWAFFHGTQRG
ncbi:hypothetical protein ACRALDRAFT_2050569 [Sodiomyces alcalophilus JCM 7366]|uniref:uncharacterized protein n=1 Tax=Sodiomyces alcalophilus JCM 7366 TaxID=591952 RepID=UPI0039B3CB7D